MTETHDPVNVQIALDVLEQTKESAIQRQDFELAADLRQAQFRLEQVYHQTANRPLGATPATRNAIREAARAGFEKGCNVSEDGDLSASEMALWADQWAAAYVSDYYGNASPDDQQIDSDDKDAQGSSEGAFKPTAGRLPAMRVSGGSTADAVEVSPRPIMDSTSSLAGGESGLPHRVPPSGAAADPSEASDERLLREFWNAASEWGATNQKNDKHTHKELGAAYERAEQARLATTTALCASRDEVRRLREQLADAETRARLNWQHATWARSRVEALTRELEHKEVFSDERVRVAKEMQAAATEPTIAQLRDELTRARDEVTNERRRADRLASDIRAHKSWGKHL